MERIKAARGPTLRCKGWRQEAILRMLENNLENAEKPDELIIYGGTGKAARNWDAFHRIVETLRSLGDDETLIVQSGKPVAVFKTHRDAPRVLIANAHLVPKWSNWETFHELETLGLTMYGQMTAGGWSYIGSQGIVQGTYETFAACARPARGIHPARAVRPRRRRVALEGSEGIRASLARVDRHPRPGDARLPPGRERRVRLREQHPRPGERGRRRGRIRL